MQNVLNRRSMLGSLAIASVASAVTRPAAAMPAHARFDIPDVLDLDRVDEKALVESAAELIQAAMTNIHGGTWRAKVDHNTGFVLITPEPSDDPFDH